MDSAKLISTLLEIPSDRVGHTDSTFNGGLLYSEHAVFGEVEKGSVVLEFVTNKKETFF